MNQKTLLIPFSLQSDAAQIFLVGRKGDEQPFILSMQQMEPGFWYMRLELHPGIYRFRYYWSDGRNTIYLCPAHALQNTVDDLDARIEVQGSKTAKAEQEMPPLAVFDSQCAAWSAM